MIEEKECCVCKAKISGGAFMEDEEKINYLCSVECIKKFKENEKEKKQERESRNI